MVIRYWLCARKKCLLSMWWVPTNNGVKSDTLPDAFSANSLRCLRMNHHNIYNIIGSCHVFNTYFPL